MSLKRLLAISAATAIVAGCESGDINLQPSTNVTDSNNTTNPGGGGGPSDVCASYVNTGGQTLRGVVDGPNCVYSPSFLDAGNNLRVDMTIPALPNDGAHIFQGSVFVGENFDSDAELAAAGIAEGGDGPVLTVEAGATIAFQSNSNFMIINRGSQLFAVGTQTAPITFTSVSDVNGTVAPEDVQQWGGMVINGFGITNQCAYTDTNADGDAAVVAEADLETGDCHVAAEGAAGLDESHYGGDNNNDSSGRLEYVVVKHTGAEVANGDELNGISFGGVGRNTVIRNLQVYSTYDDGIEMFGGAVDFENFVGVYVRDDAIDIDEGWRGTITNALVIQAESDGAHCIEADGIADFGNLTAAAIEAVIDLTINSRPTINNLTCILSPNETGTHEPGAGWRLREGIFATINNALVISSFAADTAATNNYCLRIDNRSQQAADDGDLNLNSVIYACEDRENGSTFPSGESEESFAILEGNVFATIPAGTAVNPTAAADTDLQLLEGTPPIYSIEFATSFVDGAAPNASAAPVDGATHLGGVSLGSDWTQNWTYGIHDPNRAQPLWFE